MFKVPVFSFGVLLARLPCFLPFCLVPALFGEAGAGLGAGAGGSGYIALAMG